MNIICFLRPRDLLRLVVLLIASNAHPAMATLITLGTYSGSGVLGSNPVTVSNPANCNGRTGGATWQFNGPPQNNPYQVFAATNGGTGAQLLNLNFSSDCGTTEYGINWQMNNFSGMPWHSMHFTFQFSPLLNFSVDFDRAANNSVPNDTGPFIIPLVNWTETMIDFVGPLDVPHLSGAQFHLPLNLYGNCCSGFMIITATPDFVPESPTVWLFLAGALALGVTRVSRKRAGARPHHFALGLPQA